MKTHLMLSLDIDLANEVKNVASTLGVPYSALASRLLSVVRQPNAVLALTPWAEGLKAAGQTHRATRSAQIPLKGSERLTLSHVTGDWQTAKEIGARSAQSEGVLWRALEGLRSKRLVEGGATPGTAVVRGRPAHSRWRKAGGAA